MSKNVLKLFCLSIVLLFVSCAHEKIEAPSFEGRDVREVLSEKNRISEIETKFSIVFEKKDSEIRGDGALDIASAGDMSLRVYSLGFLAMEVTSKEGTVKSTPHLDRNKTEILTRGLRDCLFWWDLKDFAVQEDDGCYLLKNPEREIWIDKRTLLPKRQRIYFEEGKYLNVYYDDPAVENDVWYQSKIRIELAKYTVTLFVKNMLFKI